MEQAGKSPAAQWRANQPMSMTFQGQLDTAIVVAKRHQPRSTK
jgi:hypothetical protein